VSPEQRARELLQNDDYRLKFQEWRDERKRAIHEGRRDRQAKNQKYIKELKQMSPRLSQNNTLDWDNFKEPQKSPRLLNIRERHPPKLSATMPQVPQEPLDNFAREKRSRNLNVQQAATTYLKDSSMNWKTELPASRRTRNPVCQSLKSSTNKISELLLNDAEFERTLPKVNLPSVRTFQDARVGQKAQRRVPPICADIFFAPGLTN
jgi:hypothetical protein